MRAIFENIKKMKEKFLQSKIFWNAKIEYKVSKRIFIKMGLVVKAHTEEAD